MTDEAALTLSRTRESTVKSSEKLAEIAEKIPRSLDEANAGLGRITSATAFAITEFGHLSASLERTTTSLAVLLEEARADARATREERQQILKDVGAITSSVNTLLSRAEVSSRVWEQRSKELAEQEARAAKAIAQLSESVARVSSRVEPDLASSSRSVATILAGVAKVTDKLAAEQQATSHWEAVAGGLAGVVVTLLASLARSRTVRPERA